MRQSQLPLAFLLVVLSTSIVTTGIRLGWFKTPSSSPPSSPPSSSPAWTQVGADIDGEAAYDYSGWSVSLSSDGKTVAIGAYDNDGNGSRSGHVRIFQWTESTSTWTQVGADIDGEAAVDWSGTSVSLSSDGKTVAIGARDNDGNGYGSGHVRIFQWNYE
jgi:hypothetical protein